jgi:hypothetical protein
MVHEMSVILNQLTWLIAQNFIKFSYCESFRLYILYVLYTRLMLVTILYIF